MKLDFSEKEILGIKQILALGYEKLVGPNPLAEGVKGRTDFFHYLIKKIDEQCAQQSNDKEPSEVKKVSKRGRKKKDAVQNEQGVAG